MYVKKNCQQMLLQFKASELEYCASVKIPNLGRRWKTENVSGSVVTLHNPILTCLINSTITAHLI